MGSATVRRFGASLFILLLALMLHGIKPADSTAGAQVRPTGTSTHGPRPTPTTHSPRPTPTTHSPRPTPTDPYPAGVGLPGALDGDSFFRVADTDPAGTNAATTMLWLFLAIAAIGLSLRWFLMASRHQRDG